MARLNKDWTVTAEGVALAAEVKNALELSVRQAKGLIDGGCVKVDGEVSTNHGLRLKAGAGLHVNYDPAQRYEVLPPKTKVEASDFTVLWEDKHLLFVDKPAGLLTVPAEKGGEPCLAESITESYRRRGFKRFELYIVHRLDRFTSGALVFAKTPEALNSLKKVFALHKLQRIYIAVLVGELPENSGTLAGHLVEHAKTLKMHVVDAKRKDMKGAKEAVTHYRVLERLPGHTVVEVKLETGRRNQIRVQFADRGFPLLGDQVYGEESPLLDRQALHAQLLGFRHPVTDEQVTVSAPLPADLERALKALRNQRRLERAEAGATGEEGIFKPKITRGRKLDRIARAKRFEDQEERPRRAAADRGPRRDDNEERPRRSFGDKPAGRGPRRDDSEERPRRSFGDKPAGRGPRRDDSEERPRRSFGDKPAGRGPRRDDSEERPRRSFGDKPAGRGPRRDDNEERPRRSFGDKPAGRGPRRDDSEERPRRSFGDKPAGRGPRRDDNEERPRRSFGDKPAGRGPRRDDNEERPRRSFGDKPAGRGPRRDDNEERPRRSFGDKPAGRGPRRDDSEERPRRSFGDKPAGRGPRRDDNEERPRRSFGEKPAGRGPRAEGGRPAFKPKGEGSGPRRAAAPKAPFRKKKG